MAATTFTLDSFGSSVPVSLIEGLDKDKLLGMKAFKDWCRTLKTSLEKQSSPTHAFHEQPYTLKSIRIESVNFFGPNIGFLKFEATISNDHGSKLPGIVFLRGGSVAVLMILRPKDRQSERYVIMTEQPRIPAGSLAFLEIPAGMLDEHDNFKGKAAEEIREETGLTIYEKDLTDMTKLVLGGTAAPTDDNLQNAMYPSPGGSDEFIPILLWEKTVDRQQIQELKGRLSQDRKKGGDELIRLRLIDYEDLWSIGARDAKTLAAWALYESLKRSGKLRDESGGALDE
ncbi:putative nudix family hydrolase [Diplodia seriata]|uniref:Putative nudix family hydrolase n=1 Tax=Diplodia seriata TaxID=420778 RepID=A0A0G2E7P5_9PEZI|nr:putative nudix family hydrolase [Diplodia seriata]